MDPDGEEGIKKKALFIKEILEGAQHEAIPKKNIWGTDRDKYTHSKSHKGYIDIVHCNP